MIGVKFLLVCFNQLIIFTHFKAITQSLGKVAKNIILIQISFLKQVQFEEYIGDKPFYCNRCPYVKPGQQPITQKDLKNTFDFTMEDEEKKGRQLNNNMAQATTGGSFLGRNGDNSSTNMLRRIHVFNNTCKIEDANYQR